MSMTLSHRPKLRDCAIIARNHELIVVLLKPSEDLERLLVAYAQGEGLPPKILHVPFTVGLPNKIPMTREEAVHVRIAVKQVAHALLYNARVFVHCSAGVHRTGTFAYAVFRQLGYDMFAAIDEVRKLRGVTADGMLPFVHWAETTLVGKL